MLPQYFNKEGRRLRRDEALDEQGIVKDGVVTRVRMSMRDASQRQHFTDARSFWDSERESLVVTDARALGGTQGNKPGYRIVDAPINATDKAAAYREHERYLNDSWRNPPTGAGVQDVYGGLPQRDAKKINRYGAGGQSEGYWEQEDDDEDKCRSTEDRASTLDQMRAKHQQNMERVYAARDAELRDAWRGK